MALTVREEQYENYGKVLYIANEKQEMRITLDVGPRVISYNLLGYENMFCTDLVRQSSMCDDEFKKIYGDRAWYIYGGHRFWISPEDYYTYYPDNDRVEYSRNGNVFLFTPPVQDVTGLLCQIEITFDEKEAKASVRHILTNCSKAEKKCSIWALSVTAEGGRAVMAQSDDKTGLTHNRVLSLWDYTDLKDERLYIDSKLYALQQIPGAENPIKIGANNTKGSVVTVNHGCIFKKSFEHVNGAEYSDSGCSTELYTCSFMLEVETLSPLYALKPGDVREHTEAWELIPEKSTNLDDVVKVL